LWFFSSTADTVVHVAYFRRLNTSLSGTWASAEYWQRVMALNPIAYWPLWEKSGTVAHCLVNPAQNGGYNSDVGVWPVGTGIGDGNTAPYFDGSNDFVDLLNAATQAAANTATTEGAVSIWFRVANAAAWTDGQYRAAFAFVDDANNRYVHYKSNANNSTYSLHYAGGTAAVHTEGGLSSTDWLHFAITWSETADEVKYYLDGALLATDTAIGTWNGDGSWTPMIIGAASYGPGNVWHGWLAHCALFNQALGQPAIVALAEA
jgi:hypothetical protein